MKLSAIGAHELERRIAPLAKFFTQAEARVRSLAVPESLSKVHGHYAEAMTLYANAGGEMLKFVQDGQDQHLLEAQHMGLKAPPRVGRLDGDFLLMRADRGRCPGPPHKA
jgi:hypothetical protein